MPSGPGWTSRTHPIAQWSGARFGCLMNTSWLVDSWVPLLAIHLVRACREWRCSLLHLRQKCCRICHHSSLYSLTSLKSTQGRLFKVMSTKKCPGLRYARSLGSALNDKTRIEDSLNFTKGRLHFLKSQMSLAHDPKIPRHVIFCRFYGCFP